MGGAFQREVGQPLSDLAAADRGDLLRAEQAVALLSPRLVLETIGSFAVPRLDERDERPGPPDSGTEMPPALGLQLPATATPRAVSRIHGRLAELAERWRDPPS